MHPRRPVLPSNVYLVPVSNVVPAALGHGRFELRRVRAEERDGMADADVIEMPRSFSIDIQSEVTPRRPALPCTAPAVLIADACSASASVSVDLPASGWLITANARRRPASASTSGPAGR